MRFVCQGIRNMLIYQQKKATKRMHLVAFFIVLASTE